MKQKLKQTNKNQPQTEQNQSKWLKWIPAVLAFIVYASSLSNEFALDDGAVLLENVYVQKGISGIPNILTEFYWSGYWDNNTGLYRPLSQIMFAIEHELSGNSAWLHHFVQVILYAISCSLLFVVLEKIFKQANKALLLIITLLFAVHPIHTEVVANIKSRDEILALFFFMCTLYFLFRNEIRSRSELIWSSLFLLLALLSKEGVVALIPIIFLLEWVRKEHFITAVKTLIPAFIVVMVWFIWHHSVVGIWPSEVKYTYQDNSLVLAPDFVSQKATALGIVARYVLKAFYPYEMAYDYSFPEIELIGLTHPLAWIGLILLIACIAGVFYFRRKNTLLSFGFALLIFPLLMTSNLIYLIGTVMADRLIYVSSLGAMILLAVSIYELSNRSKEQSNLNSLLIMAIPLGIIFSYRCVNRNPDWKNNSTLFIADGGGKHLSSKILFNEATAHMYLANGDTLSGHYRQAIKGYWNTLHHDSAYVRAHVNLGMLYYRHKNLMQAEGLYVQAMNFQPDYYLLLGNYAEVLFDKGDYKKAYPLVKKALAKGNYQAGIYVMKGTIEFNKGELKLAEKTFSEGLKRYPDHGNLLLNMGSSLAGQKRFEEAITVFDRLTRIEPQNPQAIFFLSLAHRKAGHQTEADRLQNIYNNMIRQKVR